jgi:hypothetical protein
MNLVDAIKSKVDRSFSIIEVIKKRIEENFLVFLFILLAGYLLIYSQNAQNGRFIEIRHKETISYCFMDTRNGEVYRYDPRKGLVKLPLYLEFISK